MSAVQEETLLKALSDLEDIAKGKGLPKDQKGANGGLSKEGKTMAVKAQRAEEDDEDEELEDEEKSFSDWMESEQSLAKAGDEEDESMEEEDEEEEGEEEEGEEEEGEEDEEAEKSLSDSASISDIMKSNAHTGPVVDVAPFIEALVDQVSDSDDNLRKSIVSFQSDQGKFNDNLQKSVMALGNLVLSMNKQFKTIMDSPASGRKSVLSKSEVVDRFETEQPQFSKAQVLDAMVDLVQKSQINPIDVSRFEATNSMEPGTRATVETYLKKIA